MGLGLGLPATTVTAATFAATTVTAATFAAATFTAASVAATTFAAAAVPPSTFASTAFDPTFPTTTLATATVTPAPVTPATVTPAPVTPAPVTRVRGRGRVRVGGREGAHGSFPRDVASAHGAGTLQRWRLANGEARGIECLSGGRICTSFSKRRDGERRYGGVCSGRSHGRRGVMRCRIVQGWQVTDHGGHRQGWQVNEATP